MSMSERYYDGWSGTSSGVISTLPPQPPQPDELPAMVTLYLNVNDIVHVNGIPVRLLESVRVETTQRNKELLLSQ
jgi:hypothetical protein